MRIIPAIDIIDGKCVRLSKGDYNTQKIYNENPLEVAKAFESHGINYLHLVDLDGAKNGQITNYKILERLASKTKLKIDFGGGLQSDADLKIAFECGASQITGGSIAVKKPDLFQQWIANYGAERIILGADQNNGKIAVSGWTETSELELIPFVQSYILKGISTVICTDIDKDGMLLGPNIALYQQLITEIPTLQLIASGGITHVSDIQKVATIGCEGAIVGKAIYEGIITLKQMEQFIISPQSFE